MESRSAIGIQRIRVLFACANQMEMQLLTGALRRRAEFEPTSCALEVEAVLAAVAESPVSVLVLNPSRGCKPEKELALARRIHLAYPQLQQVMLCDQWNRDLVVQGFRSGLRGLFAFGDSSPQLLCRCIAAVARGQVWASSEQLKYLLDEVTQVPSLRLVNVQGNSLLTPREEQVVALVAEGLSNRDVARELALSEHTVKKYLFRIFDKLGISTRVELVLYAMNHGTPRTAEWMMAGSGAVTAKPDTRACKTHDSGASPVRGDQGSFAWGGAAKAEPQQDGDAEENS